MSALMLSLCTERQALVVRMSDVFDFLIDALQVPLKYPA